MGDGMKKIITTAVRWMAILCSLSLTSMQAGAQSSIGPYGGTINLLVVDPQDVNTVYAIADGLFKSTDGGQHWSDTGFPNVLSLVITATDSNTLYAGTEEQGVFKSTNGGADWTATGLTNGKVGALALDPEDENIIYAGTGGGGIFKSVNAGVDWFAANKGLTNMNIASLATLSQNPGTIYAGTDLAVEAGSLHGSGVFKSTDRGEHWSSVGPGNYVVSSIVIDPTDSNILYVAVGYPNEIFKSTNGGGSWSLSNNGVIALDVRFLAIDANETNTLYASTRGGVYKTINGGMLWLHTALNTGEVTALTVPPQQTDTVYAGLHVKGVFESTDSGANWAEINQGINRRDISSIAVDPNDSNTIYAAADGEVLKTTNGGNSWGVQVTGFFSARFLAFDPTDSQVLYASGGRPRVSKSTDGGEHWFDASEGLRTDDGGVVVMVINLQDRNTLYVGTLFRGVFKTTDGAAHWDQAGLDNQQMGALALDPQNPDTVYAGLFGGLIGNYAFKSIDGGGTWFNISSGLPRWGIGALVVDLRDANTVYAGFKNCCPGEGVYKSVTGGDLWVPMNEGLTNHTVYSLAMDPTDTGTLYAGTQSGLFKTNNGGQQWRDLSSASRIRSVQSVILDPQDSQTIYAGTATRSIFVSHDGGETWQ
jgi:photosystem II stability/assembly factor-like uncharacterized protein